MQDFYTKSSKSLKEQFASNVNFAKQSNYLFQFKYLNKKLLKNHQFFTNSILFNVFNKPLDAHPIVIFEVGDKTFYIMGESIKDNEISQKYTKLSLKDGFGYALPSGIKQIKWNKNKYIETQLNNDILVNTGAIYCMNTIDFKKLYPNYEILNSNNINDNFTKYHKYQIYKQLFRNLQRNKITLIKTELNDENLVSSQVLQTDLMWLINKWKDKMVANFYGVYLDLYNHSYNQDELSEAYKNFSENFDYLFAQLHIYEKSMQDGKLQNEVTQLKNILQDACKNQIWLFRQKLNQNIKEFSSQWEWEDLIDLNKPFDNALVGVSLYLRGIKPPKLSVYNQYLHYPEHSLNLDFDDVALLLNDEKIYQYHENIISHLDKDFQERLSRQMQKYSNVQDAVKTFWQHEKSKYFNKATDKIKLNKGLKLPLDLYQYLSKITNLKDINDTTKQKMNYLIMKY